LTLLTSLTAKTNLVNLVNNVRCQSSQHRQPCQHSPKPVPTAARRRAPSGRCNRRQAAVLVFATPPDGGGFLDRVDWIDKIDPVDGRLD
jgi:hypothetical protein